MADGEDLGGFTGDQSGIGQGLAYVLPQSRTTGYFMQLANEKAQERRQEAAALAARQQKANEDYANHLYAFKTPEIANEYTKWLQPKFDDLLSSAADFHAATGQDPFTNPHFVQQTNDLNTVAKSTHQANLRATALGTALADKSKNYTPESKQAATDWLAGYYKDPISALYTAPPPLEQRNLDLNDAVKLGHATANVRSTGDFTVTEPNRHNHVVQGQAILSQPEFAPLLEQSGINSHVGDIGGIPNGHGGTIYPTDAPRVNAIADQVLQNAQQPHYAATLQAAQIDPADPHAKDKLTELIQRQNAGYGKLYGQFADRLDANVETKKVPDYSLDRLAMAEERLRMAQEKQAAKNDPTYFQDLSERVRSNDQTALQEFGQTVSGNPSYHHGVKFDVSNPNEIKVTIPAKYKYDAKAVTGENKDLPNAGRVIEKPAYTVTLNKNDPNQFTSGFAAIYKDVTGDNTAAPSKSLTAYGKGHVPGGNAAVTNPAKVSPNAVNKHKKFAQDYGL